MNRRGFLQSLIGAAAVVPAVRTWPFRTFFIPAAPRIVVPENVFFFDELAYVVYMNDAKKTAWDRLVAVELETVREEIPELIKNSDRLYRIFRGKDALPYAINYVQSPKLGGGEWKNLDRSSRP